jgi:hypothetical protein
MMTLPTSLNDQRCTPSHSRLRIPTNGFVVMDVMVTSYHWEYRNYPSECFPPRKDYITGPTEHYAIILKTAMAATIKLSYWICGHNCFFICIS